jgi:phenylalanyl-tRNA synthetase alpha chain
MKEITEARSRLRTEFEKSSDKRAILRAPEFRALFDAIKTYPDADRAAYGKAVNELRVEIERWITEHEANIASAAIEHIDVTAPWDGKVLPSFLPASQGSLHPLTQEIERICDIYQRMGFVVEDSREIDDDYHMFESLNFPDGHPARDDYDTFMTDEGFVAPAHTSTMQNRVLRKYAENLQRDEPIAVVVPDRVFRNEDLDATHEHTFYQIEGVYVGKGVTVGNLIATLSAFMNEYFGQELQTKLQPFYFPITEPSF